MKLQGLLVLLLFSSLALAESEIIGGTVKNAAALLKLDLSDANIITEPPAVARGLSFKAKNGAGIQIFVKKGQVPLTINGGDNLELYKELKIIGLRYEHEDKVQCSGEILWHFRC
jgi:hypothetical protein